MVHAVNEQFYEISSVFLSLISDTVCECETAYSYNNEQAEFQGFWGGRING